MNELITIEPAQVVAVFVKDGLDPYIDRVKEFVAAQEVVVGTAKGRKEARSLSYKVRQYKEKTLKQGRELLKKLKTERTEKVSELDEIIKAVSEECKRGDFEFKEIADKIVLPALEWEELEANRIKEIRNRILQIRALAPGYEDENIRVQYETSKELIIAVEKIETINIDESFQEFQEEAKKTFKATLHSLNERYDILLDKEEIADEKAKLATAKAEFEAKEEARKQKERERKIADKAAEDAKLVAEQKAQAERDRIQREKMEAEMKAEQAEKERVKAIEKAEREKALAFEKAQAKKEAAIQAEKERQDAEKQATIDEQKLREANQAHTEKVNQEALDAFVGHQVLKEIAEKVLLLIRMRKIPHVKIEY